MLATLLDQFPVTRGQLTPEEFSVLPCKHAARLNKTWQEGCSCSSCRANPSQCPQAWQRLALRSRVCAHELLPDSLKAVGYLSIMSLCTEFHHVPSCYFMLLHQCSRSAKSMSLLESCYILQPRDVIRCHLSPDNCCNLFVEYTCTARKSARCAAHKACTASLNQSSKHPAYRIRYGYA